VCVSSYSESESESGMESSTELKGLVGLRGGEGVVMHDDEEL